MARPLLLLSLVFALGCAVGEDVSRVGVLALLGLSAIGLVLAPRASVAWAARALVGTALALGAAGAGIESIRYEASALGRWLRKGEGSEEPVRLRGTVLAPTPRDGVKHPLVLDVVAAGRRAGLERRSGRVRVEVGGEAPRFDLAAGDRVEVVSGLDPPRASRSPGAFDPAAWARREGYHGLGYCKSPLLVRREASCADLGVPCLASRAREWARERLRRHVPKGPPQALVRAMVLGDRSALDDATSEAFRRAGTYHVLALSGAQVALVAGLLVAAGRSASIAPFPLALLVSFVLSGYAVLVGGDVPVSRAAVTGIVLLLGRSLDLDADLANLLGLAALLLLAARPSGVGDIGFQLSFGATLAIVLVAPGLLRALPHLPLGLGPLVAGSVAAQAALQPLLALHFHRLAPAAVLLNLAAVPLSGAVMVLGALLLPLSAISPWLGDRAGDLAWMAAFVLLKTCHGGGLAEETDWRTPGPTLLVLLPWLLSLRLLSRGHGLRGIALSVLVGLLLRIGPGPRADGRLEVAVLDVGQGDAVVLRSPSGRTLLVDAGLAREGFDMGERVVAPFLWSQGVREVDVLVLSHAHPDHAGGIPFLLRAFLVRETWEGIAPRRDEGHAAFAARSAEAGVRRVAVARGAARDWDGVTLEVRGPRPSGVRPLRTRNDDSVVLVVRFGAVCVVLAGDIEAGAEHALDLPACAILKVPHHGSRTSSSEALLRAVRPRLGVVSAGARNRFGHPHPEVTVRLREHGVALLRTDRDGTVRLSTDGRRIWVRRGRGGVEERAL